MFVPNTLVECYIPLASYDETKQVGTVCAVGKSEPLEVPTRAIAKVEQDAFTRAWICYRLRSHRVNATLVLFGVDEHDIPIVRAIATDDIVSVSAMNDEQERQRAKFRGERNLVQNRVYWVRVIPFPELELSPYDYFSEVGAFCITNCNGVKNYVSAPLDRIKRDKRGVWVLCRYLGTDATLKLLVRFEFLPGITFFTTLSEVGQ